MIHTPGNNPGRPSRRYRDEDAGVQGIVLVLALLLLGAAVSAILLYRATHRGPAVAAEPTGTQSVTLSDATRRPCRSWIRCLKFGSTPSLIRRV